MSIATTLLSASNLQALAVAQPLLKEEVPHSDKLPVKASSPIVQPPARTFKLNAGVGQEYVLGPGDILSVTDLCSEDEHGTVTMAPVLPDGTAVISYSGVVEAAGMSLREINDLVNEKAKKYFVHPQLMINLAKQRATQVYLLGDVSRPGLYAPSSGGVEDSSDISTGGGSSDSGSSGGGSAGGSGGGSDSGGGGGKTSMPTAGAIFTISGALQLAGGLKDTADIRHIHVTRQHPKQVIDVDLWKLMLDGDVSEDLVLQTGDVVFVPKGGSEFNATDFGKIAAGATKVRVLGAVKSPGMFVMQSDDDLVSVLARAGGFTPTAKRKNITVARTNRDGTVSVEKICVKDAIKSGTAMSRIRVRPGDVVTVDNSAFKSVALGLGRILPQMATSFMYAALMRTSTTSTVTTAAPSK
jgi:polysaccharide export outer membrane protein